MKIFTTLVLKCSILLFEPTLLTELGWEAGDVIAFEKVPNTDKIVLTKVKL